MGVENRDYMREESSYRYGGSSHPWMQNIVKTLIIVNVIVFVGQLVIKSPMSFDEFKTRFEMNAPIVPQNANLEEVYQQLRQQNRLPDTPVLNRWMTLETTKVLQGQIWRLTTYDFLHSTETIWHIVFNMWLLFLAGRQVAAKYGQYEFLWFYLTAGVFSAVFYIIWGLINGENVAAVGASGAVSAVLVLYAMNWPHHRWYIYGIIPVPVILLVVISAGMDFLPMLKQLTGGNRGDHIAHSAHIGGMLFGFLYYRRAWQISSLIPKGISKNNVFRRMRGPKLKVHQPPVQEETTSSLGTTIPPHIAEKVDKILQKISESGEASLTHEEREFLAESSRRYRR
ncbi:Rhomboid family protein [Thalassoglobus neptunius]|uniref:Rhomboid family protein n=1 Tax=Thalassoglobus neptunius TaxID=1938619 RepID=A0A5C5WPU6_9PLAN|nr:rhomboid family intramembrane serine protease [Thalassoglobus neptunius]TWT52053.1 Rhomboid family protein [Thalassoglobus neptunius]